LRRLVHLLYAVKIDTLITQNVDRFHHKAGSRNVIELHGDLSKVRCVGCGSAKSRDEFQVGLKDTNLGWYAEVFRYKPDGDAELAERSYRDFRVPDCADCGGVMKPDVVMFGEAVPRDRVDDAMSA
jgi:NAD-dependent SIR2 family protein deacetylase